MLEQSNDHIGLRKRVLAGMLAPLFMVACGGSSGTAQAPATLTAAVVEHGDAASAGAAARMPAQDAARQPDTDSSSVDASSAARVYSVVNMGQEGDELALLNERGQVAFSSFHVPRVTNSYFDGMLVHDIGSLGGTFTVVYGMNKYGELVGISNNKEKPYPVPQAFAWTLQGGMHALAGPSRSSAYAVNDSGQIAGSFAVPGISARAVRWNADGSITLLGPVPLSLSEARAINNAGLATGYGNIPNDAIHAFVWEGTGSGTDIGTLGGDSAFPTRISDRGDVAGDSATAADVDLAFFWSAPGGMLPVDASGGGIRLVAGLNERSEIAGDKTVGVQDFAYRWSASRGVVLLQAPHAISSDVFDINNYGEMAGMVERAAGNGGRRAVRWPNAASAPVDLNKQLYRAPAGLVLTAAAAINDAGAMLAYSNAGLVLLVPGKHGTDAPVLGPIAGLPESVDVGQQLTLSMAFVDAVHGGSHTATAIINDNCAASAPRVHESDGAGSVTLRHRFCAAGFFSVKVAVRDAAGNTTEMWRDIVVNAPTLAALSGRGTIASISANAASSASVNVAAATNASANAKVSASALARAPAVRKTPLHFAVWAPLGGTMTMADGTSVGDAFVGLFGPFDFRSDQVATAAMAGQVARVEGTGMFNGQAGYRFLIEAHASDAQPSASADRLHARISHTDAASGAEVLDYDNGAPAATTTATSVASTASTASTASAASATSAATAATAGVVAAPGTTPAAGTAIGAAVIDGGLTIRR